MLTEKHIIIGLTIALVLLFVALYFLNGKSERMTVEERREQVLRGLQGAEHFDNPNRVLLKDLPMLGGADLTLAAMAMRAADPLESPTMEQFKKENELLGYLLNSEF